MVTTFSESGRRPEESPAWEIIIAAPFYSWPVTYSVSFTPEWNIGFYFIFFPLCDFLGWVTGRWNG